MAGEAVSDSVSPENLGPKLSWADDGCVYFIAAPEVKRVKIGFSLGHPDERLAGLQTGSPVDLVPLGIVLGGLTVERKLHQRFAELRVRGEWFSHRGKLRTFLRNRVLPWPGGLPAIGEIEARLADDPRCLLTIQESAVFAGVNMIQMREAIQRGSIGVRRASPTEPYVAVASEVLAYRDRLKAENSKRRQALRPSFPPKAKVDPLEAFMKAFKGC